MKLQEINSHQFRFECNIQAVGLLHGQDILVLNEAGEVVLYTKEEDTEKVLLEVAPEKAIQYTDGGFIATEKSSIHVMDDMFIVSNDYKTHAIFCDLSKGNQLRIMREDYYAQFSKFPVGFFKKDGAIHIIYSTQWNRVDIANAETRQILTIGKSLVEKGAEQRHLNFYKNNPSLAKDDRFLWPSKFDYFYGDIKVSPDNSKFLSAGWNWGSCDCCKLFDIDDFIHNTRISCVRIMDGEHEGRNFCFVDNETVATIFNPYTEDEDDEDDENNENNGNDGNDGNNGNSKENRYEIRLYACSGEGKVGVIKPDQEYDLHKAQIFYCEKIKGFLLFSDALGLLVIDDDGKTLLYEPDTKIAQFDEASGLLLEICKNKVEVKEIANK